jgi:ABC-type Fe3+-hydroxamate transport system substrate-binding protein
MQFRSILRLLALTAVGVLGAATAATAADKPQKAPAPQQWEVLVPAGVIEQANVNPAPRITSLDGKTIVLRWNGKHNGDVVLNRLSVLLAQKYPTAKVVKSYELDPSLNKIAGNPAESERITKVLASLKPDIVIASQAD